MTQQIIIYSIQEFWNFYKFLPQLKRVHYEVIQANAPSKLYFDLGAYIVKRVHK